MPLPASNTRTESPISLRSLWSIYNPENPAPITTASNSVTRSSLGTVLPLILLGAGHVFLLLLVTPEALCLKNFYPAKNVTMLPGDPPQRLA